MLYKLLNEAENNSSKYLCFIKEQRLDLKDQSNMNKYISQVDNKIYKIDPIKATAIFETETDQ